MENVVVPFPAHGAAQAQGYIGNLPIPLCTVGELVAATGVSDQTIRRCIRAGEIPAQRIGHRWFIRTDKLLEEEAVNGR